MSTLKTHNLQSSDSGSVNIALSSNAGMVVTGISTYSNGIKVGTNGIKRESIHSDVDNSGANYLRFTNTTTGNGTADGFNVGIDANEDSLIWNFENKNTIFATNNLERLRILSTGTVAFKGGDQGTDAIKVESESGGAAIYISNFRGVTDTGDSTRIGVGKNNNAMIFMNASGSQVDSFAIGNTDAVPLVFSTHNTERVRILGAGNVGIGISTPDQKLHVYEQSGSSQAYLHIQNNRARNAAVKFTTTQGSWLLGQGIGADVDRLMVYDTQERLSIDSNGDVTIGTASWSYKKPLNVQGSTGSILALSNYDTTTYAANTNTSIEFRINTGNTGQQNGACEIRAFKENGTNGNNARGLNFYTGESGASPSEKFRITSFGDVYSTNSAYNTYDTAATSVETVTQNNQNRAGVYWLNFNGVKFRAYVKPNWLQGRNWVLAAKYFDPQDMPSGSSLWTNDTYVNESDFNLYGGLMSKYRSWRYFSFNRLAMQMGNRIPPIMQFNSNQTLFGAFSGGYAANGGGVTANSTDPAMSGTNVKYHTMNNYAGPDFYDVGGSEDQMQSYGLNKWANNAANSTSGNNQGSENYYPQHRIEAGGAQSADHSIDSESVKGFRMTTEDSHPNIGGIASLGRAGAWIGCPLDEGDSRQGSNSSQVGADSGFGMGGCSGNNARTWTSGYAEWNLGNSVVNCLPAYIWLSID